MPPIKPPARYILAASMVTVGVLHFANPAPFLRIMPPALPAHLELVYISGAFEIAGGLGLLWRRTRVAAAWGLVALYIAVFPANIYMAVEQIELTPGGDMPVWAMWARLPMQAVFIAWAWWLTRDDPARGRAA